MVDFTLTPEGAVLMGTATTRLIGMPLAVFLDDQFLVAPIVQSQITDRATLGGFSLDEAQLLASEISPGCLLDLPPLLAKKHPAW